ncbi:hypothetical protein [Streptomyces zaomyceticus]|uniref:hypothetical protein n=1 Tax=Streptomyces zaomyceticus TaxID=68286 RepID=UPI0016737B82|nr:hypothetical protein [Streptomyces zaomyceticus]GHG12943.1 hypothetical protein GCM10018791_28530 [Streptomyces zaomyceticus]
MGALRHLHAEMGRLADDSSRPLWPEATVSLEALAADVRMTMALVETRSRPYGHDSTPLGPRRRTVLIDDVVQAGVRAAAALAGPGTYVLELPAAVQDEGQGDVGTGTGTGTGTGESAVAALRPTGRHRSLTA